MLHIALSILCGFISVELCSARYITLGCLWAFLAVARLILGIKEIIDD